MSCQSHTRQIVDQTLHSKCHSVPTHLRFRPLPQHQQRALLPPIVLVVKVLEHLRVLLTRVELEERRGRRAVVDDAEEVTEGKVTLEVEENVVNCGMQGLARGKGGWGA